MKLSIFALALLLGSSIAQANMYVDEVTAQDASDAVVHCAEESKQLLANPYAFIAEVTGKHTQVDDRVHKKSYTFKSFSGGYGPFGPPKSGGILIVTATVTNPPVGMLDAPSRVEWTCEFSKK